MQRTLTAAGIACAAVLLAGANDQGVEFIIQRCVARKATFKELADFFVSLRRRGELMAFKQPTRVSIDHEYGVVARIEQDGVRRFRANAVHREKLFPQRSRWSAEHACQGTAILSAKKANKAFQLLSFLAEITGRAYEPSEPRQGNAFNGARRQQPF